MGILNNEAIHHILRRGTTEQRSQLIKNHKLKPEHLLSLSHYTATSDWQQHTKEMLDHGQDISSHELQHSMARASRSISDRVREHPAAKNNQFRLKEIHDNLTKNYFRKPEYYKHWYES